MRSKNMITAICALAALACAVSAYALKTGDYAPSFRLLDQFEKLWQTSDLNGKVTVIVGGTKESGRAMGPWVDGLKQQYGKRIQLLGLLHLKGVPSFGRGIARGQIRKETSDPLMVDFSGDTAKQYGINDKLPVVVVIGPDVRVRFIQQVDFSDAAYKRLTTAVDQALSEQKK